VASANCSWSRLSKIRIEIRPRPFYLRQMRANFFMKNLDLEIWKRRSCWWEEEYGCADEEASTSATIGTKNCIMDRIEADPPPGVRIVSGNEVQGAFERRKRKNRRMRRNEECQLFPLATPEICFSVLSHCNFPWNCSVSKKPSVLW
jgi:hypothetical protein